jgi:hypothetical protein
MLELLDVFYKNINGRRVKYGMFRCDCGVEKEIRHWGVTSGQTKSCGCYYKNKIVKHNSCGTRLYSIHSAMLSRCNNKNNIAFASYGGRGITVSNEWLDFRNFKSWAMKNGYCETLEIDRIDNDGDYKASNCRWIEQFENCEAGRRRPLKNTNGFTGVTLHQGSYQCRIMYRRNAIFIGNYKSLRDAVNARIEKEIELFGEQRTNFNFKEEEHE